MPVSPVAGGRGGIGPCQKLERGVFSAALSHGRVCHDPSSGRQPLPVQSHAARNRFGEKKSGCIDAPSTGGCARATSTLPKAPPERGGLFGLAGRFFTAS